METNLCLKTCELLLLIYAIKLLWSRRKFYILSMKLNGPFALPIIGNAFDLGIFSDYREIVNKIYAMKTKYGEIIRMWLGPRFSIILSEPKDVECILLSKETATKGSMYDVIESVLGKGILTDSGNSWKKHRHILNPSFSGLACRSYQTIHNTQAKLMVNSLIKLKDSGPVDVSIFCLRYAASVVTGALFRDDTDYYNGDKDEILELTPRSSLLAYEKIAKPWYTTYLYKYTNSGKTMEHGRNTLYAYYVPRLMKNINDYINEKSIHVVTNGNVTKNSMNLMADSLQLKQLTIEEIIDEYANLYITGVDTGYTQLSFFLLMMGMHKQCQDLVWREIKEILLDDNEASLTYDMLSKMPYLAMCWKEVIRLFPTGPLIARKPKNDFYMKHRDLIIPAGTDIIISNFILHRNPKYWDNPDSFIPERFSPEASAKRPHFTYIPFSGGSRNCIAHIFGPDMLKTASIHLLRNMEFHSDLKMENLHVNADISTRCVNGYYLRISERNKNI